MTDWTRMTDEEFEAAVANIMATTGAEREAVLLWALPKRMGYSGDEVVVELGDHA